ncbi:MAG: dNTP triphosphohydrolase [Sulfurimonas sp.]|uniref:deoxyguanosinetriphosphate triphosphohydrolase family protein n=1 Tax=Sulfurimonas sp. TaxID=2022749 RepID=UPI00262D5CC8|nr:dNTP triphosphohydrolase [Sulfurimonas sp.]MCW8896309.1 dNTP triphosphohydrolase [Sulfurimonas sp.]MCW8954734.1 dNTP triphosphohydrolase [Sulfurimonas sp.]MCW9068384.1 dNTP triphosphohydrolase [Sulfurimonas sp.]
MQASDRFHNIDKDFRNPYARDRDRIIHSGSFRKLEYKTQVFLNQEGDFFRTRLTHSIEVSQIARSITSHLGLNESLAEAIALAHDLGHTPFGHIGGDTLDECLKEDGFRNGFEHNFQSFRVVSSIEKRYKNFKGLNLTFATLEGILKHSYPYKKSFLPEIIDEQFNLETHPSVEAMVVDRADEIAYMSHDIDDGINSGLISFDDLKESELMQEILNKVQKEGISEDEDEMFRYRFTSHFINHLVYSLIEYAKNKVDNTKVLSAVLDSKDELPIGFEPSLETEIKKLKKLLFTKLYQHKDIMIKMFAGKQAIKGLYGGLSQEPKMMPKFYYKQLENKNKHRVIADYIAHMSDRHALNFYNEMYGKI